MTDKEYLITAQVGSETIRLIVYLAQNAFKKILDGEAGEYIYGKNAVTKNPFWIKRDHIILITEKQNNRNHKETLEMTEEKVKQTIRDYAEVTKEEATK